MKAKVDWFNDGAGYGRATNANGTRYHIHFSNIATPGCGFRTLAPGEEIEFKVVQEQGKELAAATEVKRSFPVQTIDLNAPTSRFEKIPWTIEIEIAMHGEIYFPGLDTVQYSYLLGGHPRDHVESCVSARYLGQPGAFEMHNSFSVNMPFEESCDKFCQSPTAVFLINEDGGIIHDRAHPNFKPGNYVVGVNVIDNHVTVSTKKISLRTQDSRHVTHPDDKGVWLVCETVYANALEIPVYEAGRKAEQDLKKKIEALIPAEFEWPTADNRKFAKAIARGILAIRKSR